jgi:hypothetical protein
MYEHSRQQQIDMSVPWSKTFKVYWCYRSRSWSIIANYMVSRDKLSR